jgi:hypothetical protein
MNKKLGFLVSLLCFPLVLAYSGIGFNRFYSSPLYLLDNQWVMFAVYLVVFFAIIFYTVNKSFKNPSISMVIAAGVSFLISMSMARRGLLYNYAGDQIGSILLIIAVLLGIGFLLKFAYTSFSGIGVALILMGGWFVLRLTDPFDVLPYEMLTYNFLAVYDFIVGPVGFIIVLVISILFVYKQFRKNWIRKTVEKLGKGLGNIDLGTGRN